MVKKHQFLPLCYADTPTRTATIQQFADGTYSAFVPLPDGMAIGLSRGDLAGAVEFVREQMLKG